MKQDRTCKMWRGGEEIRFGLWSGNFTTLAMKSRAREKEGKKQQNMREKIWGGGELDWAYLVATFHLTGIEPVRVKRRTGGGAAATPRFANKQKLNFKEFFFFGNEIFNDEFSFVSTASAGPNTVKHNNPGQWKWKWCICAGEGEKRFLHVSQNKCHSISGRWGGGGIQNCPRKELTLIPGQGQRLGRTPPPPLTTFFMSLAIIGERKRKTSFMI